jgi:hypothetical protein
MRGRPYLALVRSVPWSPLFGAQDELERGLAILLDGMEKRPLSFLGCMIMRGMLHRQLSVRCVCGWVGGWVGCVCIWV